MNYQITLSLPPWLQRDLTGQKLVITPVEQRMDWVIRLARANVEQETGGPFAAAVFELGAGRLIAAGVNGVIPQSCSVAHAEMMALMLAQQALETHDLGQAGAMGYELVTSVEPCAMCWGALPWSGIRQLVCGARTADARAIGFDEGEKPHDWIEALQRRGITVLRDVGRDAAAQVLRDYVQAGGIIYNGGKSDGSRSGLE